MQNPILAWLNGTSFGTSRGVLLIVFLMAFMDWVLGRSSNPHMRSIASVIATVLKLVIVRTRIALIPLVGPILVFLLETVSGRDIDGDGKVGTPPLGDAGNIPKDEILPGNRPRP